VKPYGTIRSFGIRVKQNCINIYKLIVFIHTTQTMLRVILGARSCRNCLAFAKLIASPARSGGGGLFGREVCWVASQIFTIRLFGLTTIRTKYPECATSGTSVILCFTLGQAPGSGMVCAKRSLRMVCLGLRSSLSILLTLVNMHVNLSKWVETSSSIEQRPVSVL